MGAETKIEWCDHTFNPWRGCTKVSEGCKNCYADTLSKRNPGSLGIWGQNGTRVVASEAMWQKPLKWNFDAQLAFEYWSQRCDDNKPAYCRPRVFCASLADIFEDWDGCPTFPDGSAVIQCRNCCKFVKSGSDGHGNCCGKCGSGAVEMVSLDHVRRRLFALIDATPNLDWLLLTKRPENIRRMWACGTCEVTGRCVHRKNVWLGTSVENQAEAEKRIPELLKCRDLSPVLFLSCEPLLSRVDLSQWLHKGAKYDKQRAGVSRLGGAGVLLSGQQRASLEAQRICRGKSEGHSGLRANAKHADKGGDEQVNISQDNVLQPDRSRRSVRSQSRVDDGKSIRHPSRYGSESQGRGQDEQPSSEPGTADTRGEYASQFSGISSQGEGSARGEECIRQAGRSEGAGDTQSLCEKSSFAIANSETFRRVSAHDLGDSPAQDMEACPAINWVIAGGESGPNARPMHPDWVRSLRDQCQAAEVPFMFKQWGEFAPASQIKGGVDFESLRRSTAIDQSGRIYEKNEKLPKSVGVEILHRVGKSKAGRLLDGREWNEFPEVGK